MSLSSCVSAELLWRWGYRCQWGGIGGGVRENKLRLSFREALAGLVPYGGVYVGCPRRCGFSYAGVACLSHCMMCCVGLNAVSGGLRRWGWKKMNHDESRGSFSRRTGRASHFLGPPPSPIPPSSEN